MYIWCLIRYLNPAGHHPARTKKISKGFGRKSDFKHIKIPVKIKDIHKTEKKNVSATVFLVTKIEKNSKSKFQKLPLKKHVDLLLVKERVNLTIFLSNYLTLLCTNKHYTMIENIFAFTVCNRLVLLQY